MDGLELKAVKDLTSGRTEMIRNHGKQNQNYFKALNRGLLFLDKIFI